jgi:Flp pilus assembly protein TadD
MAWNLRNSFGVAALFAAAAALYWSGLRYPPVFDDGKLAEPFLRAYAGIPDFFDLRWVSYGSFGWIYATFGVDLYWQRGANLLLHATTASFLFLFLRRLFTVLLPSERELSARYAFLGALLFLVHPVALYGVAYLIQRSILMATLFSLLSLWLFLVALERRRWGWHLAAAIAYFAAVFSKEHCVMLPAVAAALALLVRGNSPWPWRELAAPLGAQAAIALLVVLKAKGVLGAPYEPYAAIVVSQLAESDRAADQLSAYPLSVVNQGWLFFRYLGTWLLPWPGWMSIDLRTPFPVSLATWPQGAGFLLWIAWPMFAVALLLRRGRAGLAGFALLAPWLLALTEMATVRVQEPFVLYRSYLWMCLLPAAIPAVVARLGPRWGTGLLAAACVALLPLHFDRLASFSSEIRVWEDAVRKNTDLAAPLTYRAWRNRGVALYLAGRNEEALADFDTVLRLNPRDALSWMTRGTLHMRAGRSAEARADFDRALELVPHYAEARARRCVVLMRLKQLDAALEDCRLAAELEPRDAGSYTSLGMVRALRGEATEAEREYRRALELDPGNADANYQYGILLRGVGRAAEARPRFAAACAAGLQPACRAAAVP